MYYDINTEKSQCEFGIMIGDRNYWGRGYGTDVVKSALKHIFTATQLERVYLHTLVDNLRAQKSFAKAGFSIVHQVKRDGYQFVLMEIRQKDWAATQAEFQSEIDVEVLESATSSASAPQAASGLRSSSARQQTEPDPLPGS